MSRSFVTLWGWLGPPGPIPNWWPPRSDDASVAAVLDYARRRDPIGHWIHLLVAMGYLVTLSLSTMCASIAFTALSGCVLARLPIIWRAYAPTLALPLIWISLAMTVWMALTLLWSPNVAQGGDEMLALRMLATPSLLWPVLPYVTWLIGAALLGVFAQNCLQFTQVIGWWNVQGPPGRYEGWLHPIHTGSLSAMAMCWHASMIVRARKLGLILTLIAFVAAAAGLILSSSRGPWIAAAISMPFLITVLIMRRPEQRRRAFVLAGTGLGLTIIAWLAVGQAVQARIQEALDESREARTERIYWTSTGLRIAQAGWSLELINASPWFGHGAGSFRHEVEQLESFQDALDHAAATTAAEPDMNARRVQRFTERRQAYISRDHPHSTYLQVWLTQGVIGLVLLIGFLGVMLVAAWRHPPWHGYVDGTVAVMVMWIVGAFFDCYNLNGHQLGALAFAATVSLKQCMAARNVAATHDDDEADAS